MKLPGEMEHIFSVDEDYEVTCKVTYHYHPALAATREDPPESAFVEIIGVEYVSGAKNEVEESMLMTDVVLQMTYEESIVELEEIILQHVSDMEDAMMDQHYERQMEARIDMAVAQSQEEDA